MNRPWSADGGAVLPLQQPGLQGWGGRGHREGGRVRGGDGGRGGGGRGRGHAPFVQVALQVGHGRGQIFQEVEARLRVDALLTKKT